MIHVIRSYVRILLENWENEDELPDYKKVTGKTSWANLHNAAHRMNDEVDRMMMYGGGVSEVDAETARKLLNMHGGNSHQQKHGDEKIIEHVDAEDGVGKALKRYIEWETNNYLKWKAMFDKRREFLDNKLETMRKKWENPPNESYREYELLDIGFNNFSEDREGTFQDIVDFYENQFNEENEPPTVHRKTTTNDNERRILSYTTDSRGAWTGNGGRIRPNKSITIDELLANGYKILGGVGRMMGAPGESEITFIKM